ncbi:hypothetical protein BS47DRAFT_1364941 [Hydnum rufescens UP504]|uniref:Uncharacterized protein n=1 Tax=Hydnum rufescens UP504 TaxID=1448309 RepID=A0A9P6AQ60_9AGAM|nr:hypothetical protein BS47DRAFT_1364941 [Hydnum rufescens UP504]
MPGGDFDFTFEEILSKSRVSMTGHKESSPRPELRRGGSEEAGRSLTRRLSQSSRTSSSEQHPNRRCAVTDVSKDLGKTPTPSNDPDEEADDSDSGMAITRMPSLKITADPSSSGENSAAQITWETGMEEATRGGIDISGATDSPALQQGKHCGPARVEDPPQNVDEFRRAILEAMQRLKTRDDNLQSDSSNLSKDMLYDPLKELHEKAKSTPQLCGVLTFPASKNEAVLSVEHKTCYKNQSSKVCEISAAFERPDYKDARGCKESNTGTQVEL